MIHRAGDTRMSKMTAVQTRHLSASMRLTVAIAFHLSRYAASMQASAHEAVQQPPRMSPRKATTFQSFSSPLKHTESHRHGGSVEREAPNPLDRSRRNRQAVLSATALRQHL